MSKSTVVLAVLGSILLVLSWSGVVIALLPHRRLEQNRAAPVAEDIELKRHWDAMAKCRSEGRSAVMGYGYEVICIEIGCVAWTQTSKPP